MLFLWHRFSLVRFFWSSCVAYAVDFSVYLLLAAFILPELANVLSYSLGIAVTFALHRLVVFHNILVISVIPIFPPRPAFNIPQTRFLTSICFSTI